MVALVVPSVFVAWVVVVVLGGIVARVSTSSVFTLSSSTTPLTSVTIGAIVGSFGASVVLVVVASVVLVVV